MREKMKSRGTERRLLKSSQWMKVSLGRMMRKGWNIAKFLFASDVFKRKRFILLFSMSAIPPVLQLRKISCGVILTQLSWTGLHNFLAFSNLLTLRSPSPDIFQHFPHNTGCTLNGSRCPTFSSGIEKSLHTSASRWI